MGSLGTEDRIEEFKKKYRDAMSCKMEPYYYGSHYSSSAIIA